MNFQILWGAISEREGLCAGDAAGLAYIYAGSI
jgi:hypothetical protein